MITTERTESGGDSYHHVWLLLVYTKMQRVECATVADNKPGGDSCTEVAIQLDTVVVLTSRNLLK